MCIKTYAAYWNNEVRNGSASGSIFPAIAKYIIEEKHGYVCGCVLDNLDPLHIVSDKWEDVLRMRDSKYVQSSVGDCYKIIISLLKRGEYVLFSGTSCQVAGLTNLVSQLNIDSEKLYTIDFFCHGVPSPGIWKKYINLYSEEKKRKVIGYRFRSKRYGWGGNGRAFKFSVKYQKGKTIKEDDKSLIATIWYSIFFSNICLRPVCHECSYASFDKPSDFTIGDFWGIDAVDSSFNDYKGCSLIIARTEKSLEVIDAMEYLTKKEVTVEDAIARQKNAFEPCVPHPRREEFFESVNQNGLKKALPLFFSYDFRHRVTCRIKRIQFLFSLKD